MAILLKRHRLGILIIFCILTYLFFSGFLKDDNTSIIIDNIEETNVFLGIADTKPLNQKKNIEQTSDEGKSFNELLEINWLSAENVLQLPPGETRSFYENANTNTLKHKNKLPLLSDDVNAILENAENNANDEIEQEPIPSSSQLNIEKLESLNPVNKLETSFNDMNSFFKQTNQLSDDKSLRQFSESTNRFSEYADKILIKSRQKFTLSHSYNILASMNGEKKLSEEVSKSKSTELLYSDINLSLERDITKLNHLMSNFLYSKSQANYNYDEKILNTKEESPVSLYMKALMNKAGNASKTNDTPLFRDSIIDLEPYLDLPKMDKSLITKSSMNFPLDFDSNKSPSIKVKSFKSNFVTHINKIIKPTKNPALIIDTSGCKIPKMDPFDPTIIDFIVIDDPIQCPYPPSFLTAEAHGIIHLNASVLKMYYDATPNDVQCWYQGIKRKHEDPGYVRELDYQVTPVTELVFDVTMKHDYIAVKCFFRNGHIHEQYFPLVRLKKEVEKKKAKIKPLPQLNVILLAIDSISKLNYLRHFRQTRAFMKKKMNAFDMKGYTKVGDNTFPNLTPLFTGHFVEHFWNESVKDSFFFDNVSFIWKDYAAKGYRTYLAEDSPFSAAFNYLKRGFYDPPTDYYYRPLSLAFEQSELRKLSNGSPCLNDQLEADVMHNFLKNFVKTMGKRPYFAFNMISQLTHDEINYASYADAPTVNILKTLNDYGALNKSVVVLFSDHGLRYGDFRNTYIGKLEERMPFMYIHFPKWFLKQHPDFKKNLARNQDRLTTPFDIHATLKQLLHLHEPMKETDELGKSLFEEIPEDRTCDDASILLHWCPCNEFREVSVHDKAVISASQAMIDHINELLLPYSDVCATLQVAKITDARLGRQNELVLQFILQENLVEDAKIYLGEEPPLLGDYLITLRATPGGAIFEGTVRYDAKTGQSKVMGVSRTNMYKNQSWCIDSQKLKLYCFCKYQQS